MNWPKLSLIEIFLMQLAFWMIVWLSSDYLGTLLGLSIGAILTAVLLIAWMAELIEPSRVPRRYFSIMLVSIAALTVALMVYLFLFQGQLEFLKK